MKIKLWSIVTEQAWQALYAQGVLKSRKGLADREFLNAYDWMRRQMEQRIGPAPDIDQYPIWAWYQATDQKRKRPDLRETGHLASGKVGYRIEFEKEVNEVLLSDFELWHFVINRHFIPESETQARLFEQGLEKQFGTSCFEELPKSAQRLFEKSWDRIFDIIFEPKNIASSFPEKQIQATCWELRLDEVAKVGRFVAR